MNERSDTSAVAQARLSQSDWGLLRTLFAVDTRALAVMRIGLSVILIYQCLFDRIPIGHGDGLWNAILRNAWIVAIPFAVMLLIGYRTRLAAVATWILFGLPMREAFLVGEAGVPLRNYTMVLWLFWMIFLPVNAHLSVDVKRGVEISQGSYLSVATAGLLVQIFFIYISAGVTKNFSEWVFQANALETLMTNDNYATGFGRWTAQFPWLLAWASRAVVFLEIVGSLLLFAPLKWLSGRRVVLVWAFVSFHIGMALMMNLDTFPYVMIVVWLVFLPTSFWDRFTRVRLDATPVDRNRARNMLSGVALAYIALSNLMFWVFYPVEHGFPGFVQHVGSYLLLYQQWAMFSLPSTL